MNLKSVIDLQMILKILFWGARLNFMFSLPQLHTKSLCVLALQIHSLKPRLRLGHKLWILKRSATKLYWITVIFCAVSYWRGEGGGHGPLFSMQCSLLLGAKFGHWGNFGSLGGSCPPPIHNTGSFTFTARRQAAWRPAAGAPWLLKLLLNFVV